MVIQNFNIFFNFLKRKGELSLNYLHLLYIKAFIKSNTLNYLCFRRKMKTRVRKKFDVDMGMRELEIELISDC